MERGRDGANVGYKLFRTPVYRQLQQVFLGLIKSGAWPPNRSLPNEATLANEYGVSVGTIRKVIDELSDLGLVSRVQGRGTFVNDTSRSLSHALFDPIRNGDGSPIDWDPLRIEQEVGRSTTEERGQLGRDVAVLRLSWLRSLDRRVLVLQRTVIPADIGVDQTRSTHISNLGEIFSRAGIFVQRSEEVLTVAMPSPDVTRLMKLREQIPLQHVACRYFDDFDTIVCACSMWLRLEREYFACNRSVRKI